MPPKRTAPPAVPAPPPVAHAPGSPTGALPAPTKPPAGVPIGEYQVTPLDPALRCRFLQLKVRADVRAWRAWAERNRLHPVVLRLAAAHDDLLDTVPPRTWTYVSQVVSVMSAGERENDLFLND